MDEFAKLVIGGVALIPLVIGLVQVLKNLGVTGKSLTYAALGIGALVGLMYKLQQLFPTTQPVIETVIFVVGFALSALAATGIYDLGKLWLGKGGGSSAVPIQEAAKLDVGKQARDRP